VPEAGLGLLRVRQGRRGQGRGRQDQGKVKTGNKGFHQDVPREDVIIERAEVI
jgi:hypothetical protein